MTTSKGGPPESWTQELADELCQYIAEGMSLRTACKQEGMPLPKTVYRWIREREGFGEQYARACDDRADAMAEDIQDIADDGTNDWMTVTGKNGNEYEVVNNEALQRSRLRVQTRQWLMGKQRPKKYGNAVDITSGGEKIVTPILGTLPDDVRQDDSSTETT